MELWGEAHCPTGGGVLAFGLAGSAVVRVCALGEPVPALLTVCALPGSGIQTNVAMITTSVYHRTCCQTLCIVRLLQPRGR